MDFRDLYRLVFGHFGLRATGQTADSATGVLSCVLYETLNCSAGSIRNTTLSEP